MKRFFIALVWLAAALGSGATTIENDYFALTTPDDSWAVSDDGGALRKVGGRAMISRSDAAGAAIDLARIDYLEMAFTPQSYLTTQIVERRDLFAQAATTMGTVGATTLLGLPAKCVHFDKEAHGYTYRCTAIALNAGYGTLLTIQAHRNGKPRVIGRVVSALQLKCDTTQLRTTASIVEVLAPRLRQKTLPINSNDALGGVAMPDAQTLELTVIVPYITRDVVDVPRFVQVKRDEWMRSHAKDQLFTLLEATAMAEKKNLRYVYVDDKRHEIGTLLIMPEEYE